MVKRSRGRPFTVCSECGTILLRIYSRKGQQSYKPFGTYCQQCGRIESDAVKSTVKHRQVQCKVCQQKFDSQILLDQHVHDEH